MVTRSWVRFFMCATFLYTSMQYPQGTHGRCSCVFSVGVNAYNITSLQSENDTARFTIEHELYKYSYNPCRSFHFVETPSFGDCQDDMAMCWWLQDRMYRKIAEQSTAKCAFNEYYKMPMLQYTGDGYIRKTTVLLNCNQSNEHIEQAIFEAVDTSKSGEFVFKLTHKCACPNACMISPSRQTTSTATDAPSDPIDCNLVKRVVPVVAAVGVSIFLIVLIVVYRRKFIEVWLRVFRRQHDNERQPILGNQHRGGEAEETQYNIRQASTSQGTSGEYSSRSSNKNDFNIKIKTKLKKVPVEDIRYNMNKNKRK